ncbi:hypothetical protein ACSU6B_15810 [Neobacillus sp. C211]|uniref:hypothetical protein n=1 Tax=unclassified Neobacillus TaxID=2675272 RepID=UPI00397AF1AA
MELGEVCHLTVCKGMGDGVLVHDEERYPLKKGTHLIIPVVLGDLRLTAIVNDCFSSVIMGHEKNS